MALKIFLKTERVLVHIEMVHMPSLENWEWGLKIFCGTNSHHPCGPSLATTDKQHTTTYKQHTIQTYICSFSSSAHFIRWPKCSHNSTHRLYIYSWYQKSRQHRNASSCIKPTTSPSSHISDKVTSHLQWGTNPLLYVNPYANTILIEQCKMSFSELLKRLA